MAKTVSRAGGGKSAKGPKGRPPTRRLPVLWIAMGVVVLLGIVAIVASRGGSSNNPSTSTPTSSAGTGDEAIQQTRPVTASGTALPQFGSSDNDPAVGTAAPKLTGKNFAGDPVTIGGTGQPELVFFVAHWCPHCRREVPLISKWLQQNGMPKGIELRALSTGVSKDAPNYPPSTWLANEDWPVTTMADSDAQDGAKAFGLSAYPFFVAIDKDGKVVARASGELETSKIDALIAAAKGGTSQ